MGTLRVTRFRVLVVAFGAGATRIAARSADVRFDEVDNGKVLDLFRDRVEGLVHGHAPDVSVVVEADNDAPVLFDVRARGRVGVKVQYVQHSAASCGAGTARVHVSESSSAENFCRYLLSLL